MGDLSTNPGMTGEAVAMRAAKATVYPGGVAAGPAHAHWPYRPYWSH
ncbi:hypothetical protein [Burkholderia sp. LMG 32019]